MSEQRTSDESRDEHLLAALRNAPDRDLTPSAQLSASILDQARAAAQRRQSGGKRLRQALGAAFARLWHPAPVAAFATLAMATLIGVMWGGQTPPDAAPALRREQAAPAPAESTSQLAKESGALDVAAAGAAAAPTPRGETNVAPAKPAANVLALPQAAAAPAAVLAARQAAQPARKARADVAIADALPAVADAPAAVTAAASPRAAAAAPLQREVRAKSIAETPSSAAGERGGLAAGALDTASGVRSMASADFVSEIDAAALKDAARARWRLDGQREIAHGAVQREWWASLMRATAGRWQRVEPLPRTAAAPRIEFVLDGELRGRLELDAESLLWTDASGRAWRAPGTAAQLREWQAAVARW